MRSVTTTYAYDAAGELTSAGSVSYAYDANGSRTSRTAGATTTYTWNSDNLLAATSSPSLTTSYVYDGENQRVAASENGVTTDFVLDVTAADELVLQETTGEEVTTYTFGAELGTPDLTGSRFRFTGQWADAAGLTFLRARFTDPETGTFLSVDPVPSSCLLYTSPSPRDRG